MAIDPKRQIKKRGKETANLLWFDALVRHQIFITRMSGAVRNDIIDLLNKTEADLSKSIRRRLSRGGTTTRQLKRAEALMKEISLIRGAAHDKIEQMLIKTMTEFVQKEARFVKKAVETSVPVEIDTTLPHVRTLRALVKSKPFEGATLKSWSDNMRVADIRRISEQVKIGIVQGEAAPTIARRVVGTARLMGRDGVTQITRRNAEAITRTATNHFSNAARSEFMVENSDIFSKEMFVATLDARTTRICSSLDGKQFTVGEGPNPPMHFNCRSLRVAVLTQEALGSRPMKPTTERQLVGEYARQRGLGNVRNRSKLPYGSKGSFDQFSRRRVRELIGRVPAKTTYQNWLGTQSKSFQEDVLGKTRATLFRRGKMKLTRFVNRKGDEIPLSDLAHSDARAFRAAGLDPGDYT